jgi:hypothetical protein
MIDEDLAGTKTRVDDDRDGFDVKTDCNDSNASGNQMRPNSATGSTTTAMEK